MVMIDVMIVRRGTDKCLPFYKKIFAIILLWSPSVTATTPLLWARVLSPSGRNKKSKSRHDVHVNNLYPDPAAALVQAEINPSNGTLNRLPKAGALATTLFRVDGGLWIPTDTQSPVPKLAVENKNQGQSFLGGAIVQVGMERSLDQYGCWGLHVVEGERNKNYE